MPFQESATLIGRRLNVPVVAKSQEETAAHFGWFATFAGMDLAASSARTRHLLGWEPRNSPACSPIWTHSSYFGGQKASG